MLTWIELGPEEAVAVSEDQKNLARSSPYDDKGEECPWGRGQYIWQQGHRSWFIVQQFIVHPIIWLTLQSFQKKYKFLNGFGSF